MLLAVWQFGAPMVIFLAGLKQIPNELYEAAAVDGAGAWRQFRNVTLPMLSPVIFFNLVLETINGFQGFTSAFVLSNGTGGPVDSTLMYTLYLYIKGFTEFEMGYASAMAWVFLLAIGLITVVLFRTGRFWVHYSDAEDSDGDRRRPRVAGRRLAGAAVLRSLILVVLWPSCSTRCCGWSAPRSSRQRRSSATSALLPERVHPGQLHRRAGATSTSASAGSSSTAR